MYLWWMYQPCFCKPWKNQLHCQFVLTQFAESRSLHSRKSAIHKVGLKTPRCYWGAFVDPLMLLFTDARELIFTKSIHWGTSLCQMRGWAPERLWFTSRKIVCGSAKAWSCTLSASTGCFLFECPTRGLEKMKRFQTWGIWRCSVVWWILDRVERGLTIWFWELRASRARIAWLWMTLNSYLNWRLRMKAGSGWSCCTHLLWC